MDKIREALEGLVKGKESGTFEVSCEAHNEEELQEKVNAADDLWTFARKALAELDKPAESDARDLARKVYDNYGHNDNNAAELIESFVSARERKASEDTASKCADAEERKTPDTWSNLEIGMLAAMMTGDIEKDWATLAMYLRDEPKEHEAEGPQVGDACLFWDETRYGIEYDVGLLSLHHNGEYYMRSGFGWKNCRALARQITIEEITRADGDSREG